jgi:hypothetical protein
MISHSFTPVPVIVDPTESKSTLIMSPTATDVLDNTADGVDPILLKLPALI